MRKILSDVAQHHIKVAEQTTLFAGSGTTGFSVWAWLGENSNEIVAACALGGLVITTMSALVSLYLKLKK